MECFDVDAIVDLCEAAYRFAGEEVDHEELKNLVGAHAERLQQSQAALAEAGGGEKCRYWWTISCSDSNDGGFGDNVMFMQRGPIDTGPKPRPIMRRGGKECWKVGKCWICLHYECEQVAHQ